MAGDILNFALLAFSSIIIIVNPFTATLTFVSLTEHLEIGDRKKVARDSTRYSVIILLIFALLGAIILQLFGISLEAFRIAGGILLFGIGMEMIYARTSRTKLTATEKYESMEAEDVAIIPLAFPMITGPGAITTTLVLMNETGGSPADIAIVILAIITSLIITYLMMVNSDKIVARIGQREYRAINRLMGMLLIAIAVQFVITGVKLAFPVLGGG
ncbi:MAG TPA: NAAT family transporter [Methanoregulaceae archaeon]|nr:NAAT family transporter [Methanoregulaceae archaeon]